MNGNQKKASVAILISHKTDFKMKNIIRDEEGHYMMIKGSIQEEDITIGNIYAPNTEKPQYTRQAVTCIRGQYNSNKVIVGDFNTPHTPMDRSSRQRINKETQNFNETLDPMDLVDIFRAILPNAEEYTLFSTAHGTFSRTDHILGHRPSLSKF